MYREIDALKMIMQQYIKWDVVTVNRLGGVIQDNDSEIPGSARDTREWKSFFKVNPLTNHECESFLPVRCGLICLFQLASPPPPLPLLDERARSEPLDPLPRFDTRGSVGDPSYLTWTRGILVILGLISYGNG